MLPVDAETLFINVRLYLFRCCCFQGSSEGSILSSQGELQAMRCRDALRFIPFDCCFASPLERAKVRPTLCGSSPALLMCEVGLGQSQLVQS